MPVVSSRHKQSYAAHLRVTCSVLALAATAAPGVALATPSVFATQTYTLGGTTNTVSDSTIADVLPSYNVGTNSIFGHSYAYPNGTNGSRSSGTNDFSINGLSTYDQFYSNSTSSVETLNIPFEVAGGQVGTDMSPTTVGTMTSGVEAKINLTRNGSALPTSFDYKADMTLTSNGAGTSNLTFALTGPQIGGPPLPPSTPGALSGSYSWSTYDSVVSVVLQPGDNLEFLYTITSYATGAISSIGTCTGTGIGGTPPANHGYGVALTLASAVVGGGGGNTGCYNDAIGRIGDPFNPSIVPQSVPEPLTMAVLGSGLAALAFNRRRRTA
jgi:hypothetical protein